MLFPKFAFVVILISLLDKALAQQTFESRGKNYHAKVLIHRSPPLGGPQPRSDVRISSNDVNGQVPNRQEGDPRQERRAPWKQGNRITKQEGLLSNKRARLEEIEKKNRERHERLVRKARKPHKIAQPLPPQSPNRIAPPAPEPLPVPPQNIPIPRNQVFDSWRSDSRAAPVVRGRTRNQRSKKVRSAKRSVEA